MGKTDTATKVYIRKNNIFADAFNYLIYDGKPVVNPEQLLLTRIGLQRLIQPRLRCRLDHRMTKRSNQMLRCRDTVIF